MRPIQTLCGVAISCASLATPALANGGTMNRPVSVSEQPGAHGQTVVTLENRLLKITVVPARGGRVSALWDKRSGLNHVYWAEGPTGLGGLLDDHSPFSEQTYEHTLRQDVNEAAVTLRLARPPLTITKTLTLRADSPVLTVEYAIANGSQQTEGRLQNRNFIVPGGGSVTRDDVYFVPISNRGVTRHPYKVDLPLDVYDGGLIAKLGAAWSAFLDSKQQSGLAICFRTEFARGLYHWLDSDVYPTYEWFALPLEPGLVHRYTVDIVAVHGLSGLVDANRHCLLDASPTVADGRLKVPWRCQLWAAGGGTATLVCVVSEAAGGRDLGRKETALEPAAGKVQGGEFTLEPNSGRNLLVTLEVRAGGAVLGSAVLPVTQEAQPTPLALKPVFEQPRQTEPIPGWRKLDEQLRAQPTAADAARKFILFERATDGVVQPLAALAADLGRGEFESLAVQVYPLEGAGRIMVALNPGGRLPLEARIQEDEEREEKYWKMRIVRRKLVAADGFDSEPGVPRSVWLTIQAPADLPPGEYTETVTVRAAGGGSCELPLKIKVWPVRLPASRFFPAEAEHYVNLLPGIGPQGETWNIEQGRKYIRDLVAHNIPVAQVNSAWTRGDANLSPEFPHARIRATGEPLLEAIRQDPKRFQEGELPVLDFTFWNPVLFLPIEEGMNRIQYVGSYVPGHFQNFLSLSQAVYGPQVAADSAEHARIRQWMLREIGRCLDELGYRVRHAKIDDETPPDKFPLWNRAAAEYRAAGFRTLLTTGNFLIRDPAATRLINPFLDLWQIGGVNPAEVAARRAAGEIDTADELWSYTGSGTIWQTYETLRATCGLRNTGMGLTGFHIHEYYRWNQDGAIIYPSDDGPVGSPAWEGARDGLDDARYHRYAQALIERLPAAEAAPFSARLRRIVGEADDCLVRLRSDRTEYGDLTEVANPNDLEAFRAAKRELLAMIVEMEQRTRLPSQLTFGDLDLGDWTFVAGQGVDKATLARLSQQVESRLGIKLAIADEKTVAAGARRQGRYVLLGGPAESEWVRALNADLRDKAFLDRWPAPGWYVIRLLDAAETGGARVLLVGGRDADGTARACVALGNLLQ